MKSKIIIFVAGVLTIGLVGCSKEEETVIPAPLSFDQQQTQAVQPTPESRAQAKVAADIAATGQAANVPEKPALTIAPSAGSGPAQTSGVTTESPQTQAQPTAATAVVNQPQAIPAAMKSPVPAPEPVRAPMGTTPQNIYVAPSAPSGGSETMLNRTPAPETLPQTTMPNGQPVEDDSYQDNNDSEM